MALSGDQAAVIAFLSDGAAYGRPGTAVTRIDTHASIVFMVTRAMADSVRVFATAIPIALIMGPVLPREYLMPSAIIVLGALTIVYTWRGGMRAVVWTELLQASIYITGGICAVVLLGHTRDDQAETVLLGLARGSGARALAGMPARRGRFRRPVLSLSRATLRQACLAQRLDPWDDPHNCDPAYARVRVRRQALPALEEALGPGIAEALARTAAQLSADCEALDAIARGEAWRIQPPAPVGPGSAPQAGDGVLAAVLSVADIDGLAALAPAIRTRVLRQAALLAGCPGGSLTGAHIAALDALVTGWHGQRGTDLPGAIRARRQYGRLLFSGGSAVSGGPVEGGPVRVGSPEWTEAEATGGRE